MARALCTFVLLALLPALAACPGTLPPPNCPCQLSTTAVQLTVVDAVTGDAVENFAVEHLINGEPRGVPENCDQETRTGNFCEFGLELGVYDLIVTAPGYATRETRARQFARSGDACCDFRLAPRVLTVELDPL
jgi:hypothetical protein